MGGRRLTPLIVAAAFAAAGCHDGQKSAPTEPEFTVRTGCNFTTVSSLVKNEFGPNSAETGYAGDMRNAGAQTDQATYDGYLILDAIAIKYNGLSAPGSPAPSTSNASAATVALLSCMNIGGAAIPATSVIDASLGLTGGYGVPGLGTTADFTPIQSHDGAWTFEPPGGVSTTTSWQDMTTVLNTGITDPRVAHTIWVYGRQTPNSDFTKDQATSVVFDWSTLPHASFDPTVVIGECLGASNYLQHNPTGSGAEEVLGFLKPSCYQEITSIMEREPRTFAERIFRFLGPSPAYATLLTKTGSGGTSACKTCLSPFEVIFPGFTALLPQGNPPWKWSKSGNTVNVPFAPAVIYQVQTAKGTDFKQSFILVWLEATNNQGVKVVVCDNYDYTDEQGVADLHRSYLNKAGGYTITTRTAGAFTLTLPNGGGTITVPTVPPSAPLKSPLINVKNDVTKSPPDDCTQNFSPIFDSSGNLTNPPPAPGPNG
jgi:hypothetical protein